MKMSNYKLQILNALFFAGLMLLMAMLFSGSDYGMTINHMLIALWFVASSYLSGNGTRKCTSKSKSNNDNADKQG